MSNCPLLLSPAYVASAGGRWVVLDASWVYPPFNVGGIDVRARYAEAHIPGARFLDLETMSAPYPGADDVPSLRPPHPDVFLPALAAAGIEGTTPLVVTDTDGGTTTAPFARLALLDAGFADVRLLDGGTPAWVAAGLPLTDDAPSFVVGEAVPATGGDRLLPPTAVADQDAATVVIDARGCTTNEGVLPLRFRDVAIPADLSLAPADVIDDTGLGQRFKPVAELQQLRRQHGLTATTRTLTTCFFGVGAATVATALELAGLTKPQVDAGSILTRGLGR